MLMHSPRAQPAPREAVAPTARPASLDTAARAARSPHRSAHAKYAAWAPQHHLRGRSRARVSRAQSADRFGSCSLHTAHPNGRKHSSSHTWKQCVRPATAAQRVRCVPRGSSAPAAPPPPHCVRAAQPARARHQLVLMLLPTAPVSLTAWSTCVVCCGIRCCVPAGACGRPRAGSK